MNDQKWLKIDEKLYELLLKYFNISLSDQKELDKYHGFRNDVIDLFKN
jgi:hypothetical protein